MYIYIDIDIDIIYNMYYVYIAASILIIDFSTLKSNSVRLHERSLVTL